MLFARGRQAKIPALAEAKETPNEQTTKVMTQATFQQIYSTAIITGIL
jgi:hypothetical protein